MAHTFSLKNSVRRLGWTQACHALFDTLSRAAFVSGHGGGLKKHEGAVSPESLYSRSTPLLGSNAFPVSYARCVEVCVSETERGRRREGGRERGKKKRKKMSI